MGNWVAISPSDCIMQYTATPMMAYANRAPPGPAWAMAVPLAKNRPVPMAPPIAIMLSCRVPIPRLSSRASPVVMREISGRLKCFAEAFRWIIWHGLGKLYGISNNVRRSNGATASVEDARVPEVIVLRTLSDMTLANAERLAFDGASLELGDEKEVTSRQYVEFEAR